MNQYYWSRTNGSTPHELMTGIECARKKKTSIRNTKNIHFSFIIDLLTCNGADWKSVVSTFRNWHVVSNLVRLKVALSGKYNTVSQFVLATISQHLSATIISLCNGLILILSMFACVHVLVSLL